MDKSKAPKFNARISAYAPSRSNAHPRPLTGRIDLEADGEREAMNPKARTVSPLTSRSHINDKDQRQAH
jgi:hypothetical protein